MGFELTGRNSWVAKFMPLMVLNELPQADTCDERHRNNADPRKERPVSGEPCADH